MIGDEPPPGPVAPLSFGRTVSESFRLLSRNFSALAKVSAIPFVLTLLIGDLAPYLDPLTNRLVWDFGIELPWTLMAVAWIRHLLLESAGEARVFPKLHRRQLRFLGYALLLSFIYLPLTLFPQIADFFSIQDADREIAYWALYIPLLYISLRLGFIYLAVAVDEAYSLRLAWQHTRGISLTLFLAVGLAVMLPWALFSQVFGLIPGADSPLFFIAAIAWYLGLWVVEGAYLAFLIVAFRRATGWVPKPDKAILERFE